MQLQEFSAKVQAYRRATSNTQKELAEALGLHPQVLSRKFNGLANASLTHPEIKQIIKTLASWMAITTQAEALELLELMDLKLSSFSPEEWNAPPLNQLEKARSAPASRSSDKSDSSSKDHALSDKNISRGKTS